MHHRIKVLSRLGQGQLVRLVFEDGDVIEMRVNQMEYIPDERLRIECSSNGRDGDGRYQAEAHVEGGEWTALKVQRYDREVGSWTRLDRVTDVVPLKTFRSLRSADMEAQERIGTGRVFQRSE